MTPVRVDALMAEIEASVRNDLRRRVVAAGGPAAYRDAAIFEYVSTLVARAADRRPEALLLPELLGDEEAWRPATELRFTSHRKILGPFILFARRRLVLPLVRWLYEYADENFRRQEYVNHLVLACLEELAIENARLRAELVAIEDQPDRGR